MNEMLHCVRNQRTERAKDQIMIIATQLLLSTLAVTDPTYTTLPDTCDRIRQRSDKPQLCEPHRAGAPVWDDDVCCDEKNCFAAAAGGCESNELRSHCEYGEQVGRGVVQCYYEVPDYCEANVCEAAPGDLQAPLEEGFLCCQYGYCMPYIIGSNGCPYGEIEYCMQMYSNEDGSVGCEDFPQD